MESPKGRVIEVATDGDGRLAVIHVDAPLACARCAAGKGCGAGVFASGDSRRIEATVPDTLHIAAGDTVAFELADRALLPAASIVYGWPLAGAVAGGLLASLGPWTGDAVAAAGAAGGLVLAAILASRRLGSTRCVSRFRPVVLARIDAGV